MKYRNTLIRFLGGIQFAIILIASTALFVIVGTLVESLTDSHEYAALFTYNSWLFSCLLWGFFCNILISAIRRWPFQIRHIPFLITHLGLLMILGGVIIKNVYGTQGTLSLIEGSGNDEIALAGSHALYLEEKDSGNSYYMPFKMPFPHHTALNAPVDTNLKITLLDSAPNSNERLETWVKGDRLHLTGLAPIQLNTIDKAEGRAVQFLENEMPWEILAIDCDDVGTCLSQLYVTNSRIIITDRTDAKVVATINLLDLLSNPQPFLEGTIYAKLQLDWSPIDMLSKPALELVITTDDHPTSLTIPLDGDEMLLNQWEEPLSSRRYVYDIERPQQLIFLRESKDDVYMIAIGCRGQILVEPYRQSNLKSIVAYDDGFGGYAVHTSLPSSSWKHDRIASENARQQLLVNEFQKASTESERLAPPLKMLWDASKKCDEDFVQISSDLMQHWSCHGGWLCTSEYKPSSSLEKVMNVLTWESDEALHASFYTSMLFGKIEPLLMHGHSPDLAIKRLEWPLEQKSNENVLQTATWQIFAAANILPIPRIDPSPQNQLRWLSAYCRAWEIDPYQMLESEISLHNEEQEKIHLECPLTPAHQPIAARRKLENNTPCLLLRAGEGLYQQQITLAFDRMASKIKWPLLQGKFLARFQPNCQKIPYRLRLRQARQVNYAGSQQPYSYECDLLITEKVSGEQISKTISMNEVHETWEGYRFYLSNVYPPSPGEIKRVQIVVNYDPAKYLLTYPGASVLSLGVILLFGPWFRPKKRNDKK